MSVEEAKFQMMTATSIIRVDKDADWGICTSRSRLLPSRLQTIQYLCVLGVEGICREIDFGLLNTAVEDC